MQLVETIEVGAGGAASIEFTSIPQDADDLLLVLSLRSNRAVFVDNLKINFNSDTGNNYAQRYLAGDGSSASSSSNSSFPYLGGVITQGNSSTGSTFGNLAVYVPNYTSSTAKSASIDTVTENNATSAYAMIQAGSWTGTAAISSVQLAPALGTLWLEYSSASLYKITKA